MDNNYYCERCVPEKEGFKTIRRSHLELYNTCQYAVYLTLEKGIIPPNNAYAEVGIKVHELIDKVSVGLISVAESIRQYKKWCNGELEEHEKYEQFMETGINSLNGFADIMPSLGKDFETERNIIYSLSDSLPSVSCTIDRIDKVNGAYHISDWKTGKVMAGQKLIEDLQPPLYIQAVKEEFKEYPLTFTLYYLAEGKARQYVLQNDGTYKVTVRKNEYVLDISAALEKTKEILTRINNRQYNSPQQTHEWYCKNMCWFYESGICASSSKEEWGLLNKKYNQE